MVFNGGSEAVKHITEWKFVPLFYTLRLWLRLRTPGFGAFCRRGGAVEQKIIVSTNLNNVHTFCKPARRRSGRWLGV